MTNPGLTLIAALLDRSGSMEECKKATETGFDELIAEQRSLPGEAIVPIVDVRQSVRARLWQRAHR